MRTSNLGAVTEAIRHTLFQGADRSTGRTLQASANRDSDHGPSKVGDTGQFLAQSDISYCDAEDLCG
jgi:hypothetical protein